MIKGRITRMEYFISLILFFIVDTPLLLGFKYFEIEFIKGTFACLSMIPLAFILIQGAKRCHDRGNRGLYQFIPFYVLVMILGDSDYGINKYGPNPKNKNDQTINTTTDDRKKAFIIGAVLGQVINTLKCNHCGNRNCNCNK